MRPVNRAGSSLSKTVVILSGRVVKLGSRYSLNDTLFDIAFRLTSSSSYLPEMVSGDAEGDFDVEGGF